jgi:hypothetical protein
VYNALQGAAACNASLLADESILAVMAKVHNSMGIGFPKDIVAKKLHATPS